MDTPLTSELLFSAALELDEPLREAFVFQNTEGDTQVREEVLLLLENHREDDTDGFILDRAPSLDGNAFAAVIGDQPGDEIGPYKLLERIGEGGMGVVYMAEQQEGIRRKVALKIIKLGMDTRQVVARFEVERQAMALFDHPNIARVLDAGATESGRPFFVMELVRGTHISEFVKKQKLPLEARLELFIAVCNAIQHAHQKGIIHRDLKPSNILVTQFDGVPVPKVIDFGIAKAIGQRLTDKTLFTRYAAMVGTPQYMSPEQAELTGIDVDTRSDIYSLGVILYELITGTTPLKTEQLEKLNPLALFETLRDVEIETPSARAAKTAEASATMSYPANKASRIKGELDWIVMKALSRDRRLRYATANELSADVQRYLDGDAVLAVPPSKWYRLRHYAWKHRTAVVTTALIASVLLLSSILSSLFALNAYHANKELVSSLENERKNLSRAEAAERELRAINENQLYDTAHSIALAKFQFEFGFEFEDMISEAYKEQSEVFENGLETLVDSQVSDGDAIERDNGEEFDATDFFGLNICIGFENDWLLDFSKGKSYSPRAKRLERFIVERNSKEKELDQFMESFVPGREENKKVGGASDQSTEQTQVVTLEEQEHEHSKICLVLQAKARERLKTRGVDFFRLLVKEYRKVFGEDDPRVSEALTLLAAKLIELGNLNEAEPHLREAISLRKKLDCEIEHDLLEVIKKRN